MVTAAFGKWRQRSDRQRQIRVVVTGWEREAVAA
jgi:hypothetical protein